jgi:predicted peptidase
MNNKLTLISAILLCCALCNAQSSLQLKTANEHPMKYYISLPNGYSKSKSWPVVLVLEAAEKEFEKNAMRFVEARGGMPFIIIAPVNTNNGNQGRRDPNIFPYSKETWDYIEKVGDCEFNLSGIHQIMLDVQKEFNAEEKIYITGFEAGCHDLWSIVFNHPEYLKAAAPVAGNFRNRCTSSSTIPYDNSSKSIPIMSFAGSKDELAISGPFRAQWLEAKQLALSKGFTNISEKIIDGEGHIPLPKQVLTFFASLQVK